MKNGNINLELLKQNFEENEIRIFPSDTDEIEAFQKKYNVEIPQDLRNYYLDINGSGNGTLNNLYEFYSINHTKKIVEELINWAGIPDYSKLNFTGMENVFVFEHMNLIFTLLELNCIKIFRLKPAFLFFVEKILDL